MKNEALVIQNIQNPTFDAIAFMTARNLVADYCSTEAGAL